MFSANSSNAWLEFLFLHIANHHALDCSFCAMAPRPCDFRLPPAMYLDASQIRAQPRNHDLAYICHTRQMLGPMNLTVPNISLVAKPNCERIANPRVKLLWLPTNLDHALYVKVWRGRWKHETSLRPKGVKMWMGKRKCETSCRSNLWPRDTNNPKLGLSRA